MIQTSFFRSQAPKERKVCIAKFLPRFWRGPIARKLAPTYPKAPDWREAYRRDLEERFPGGVGLAEYLADIAAQTKNPILCCYESNPSQCHRAILAAYAAEHLGLEIMEWSGPQMRLL